VSKSESLRLADYLGHIVGAIERIDEYVGDMTEVDFLTDQRTQDAVVRNFEIIGEACRCVVRSNAAFAELHPEVSWSFAWEMRNALAHGYFNVDFQIVWRTIHGDLPDMASRVRSLAAAL